jgi:hypothetical protein
MLKRFAEAAGIALTLMAVMEPIEAEIQVPDQCWPDCNSYYENLQCQAWFGTQWYYCGWNNGYTYCCGGE